MKSQMFLSFAHRVMINIWPTSLNWRTNLRFFEISNELNSKFKYYINMQEENFVTQPKGLLRF